MKAFIGLLFPTPLQPYLNIHSTNILFSNTDGLPIFGATMSKKIFTFFDDFETREDRLKHDRFAAIQKSFEKCNVNSARSYIPDDYLSIDETLYAVRAQVSVKQFNWKKPAKCGMLFKSINSATEPYTYQTHAYCGKSSEKPNELYVCGTINFVKYLVTNLEKDQSTKIEMYQLID